jgi:hypothetical protein
MSRFKAAAIHFGVSAAAVTVLVLLLLFVWYPELVSAIGADEILLMVAAVDVCLGPLLTLIVFKAGKKSLKFDLAVIALLQVAAFAYGAYSLFIGRPVYIAALGQRFDVISASDVEQSALDEAKTSLPLWGPKWVGTRRADEPKERDKMMMSGLMGIDYGHYPKYHVDLVGMLPTLEAAMQPIAELKKLNKDKQLQIDAWLKARGVIESDVRFLGLKARRKDSAVIIDIRARRVIGIAPFEPWS